MSTLICKLLYNLPQTDKRIGQMGSDWYNHWDAYLL